VPGFEFALKVAPLALLVFGAGVAIWRGTSRRPDDGKNKSDIGGGPGDGGMLD
jgi:hypothetical protein